MIKYSLFIILLSSVVICGALEKLPSYITQCGRSDPNINECVLKSANAALPTVIKGDKKYKIPILSPLKINEILISPSPDFHIGLNDVLINGLENTVVTKADVNPEVGKIHITITVPRIEILSRYDAKGKISILPFNGQGQSNITLLDGTYVYSTILVLEKRKDGLEYGKPTNTTVDYTPKQIILNFENILSEKLGGEINKFLNENWRDLTEEFKPTISNAIMLIASAILDPLLVKIPITEIFGP